MLIIERNDILARIEFLSNKKRARINRTQPKAFLQGLCHIGLGNGIARFSATKDSALLPLEHRIRQQVVRFRPLRKLLKANRVSSYATHYTNGCFQANVPYFFAFARKKESLVYRLTAACLARYRGWFPVLNAKLL